MIQHLGQHATYLGWILLDGKHYAFAFEGREGKVLIAWAAKGSTEEVRFGKEVREIDSLSGKETLEEKHVLTASPVFLLDVPERILEQARANKGKPLPWGGDYSGARSVSLTMGGEQVEKGLHTQSGDAVAQAVVAYGGSARAGNVPGGNLFIVDPAFLSYTTVRIEITAVVRRNEANDNAGFKLVYESTTGFNMAKSGWFTVPDNKQWHTVRWRIDDCQFVNYWGFNFAFESDANEYNEYYLQSVTVTKLVE